MEEKPLSKNLYETMFLVDSEKGGEDFSDLIQHISGLMERNGAEIERIEKWDERKLAYRIRGADRGIYIQVHMLSEPNDVAEIRNAINLSEEVLRVLILTAEEVPPAAGPVYNTDGEEVEAEADETETVDEEAE